MGLCADPDQAWAQPSDAQIDPSQRGDESLTDLTYDMGWDALIARYEARRAPVSFDPHEALAPLTVDLAALLQTPVLPPAPLPARPSDFRRKSHTLETEFVGAPQLFVLHALVISCLRKRAWPDHAPALFRRIWTEQSAALCETLPTRWLISAAITFADHGATSSERSLGESLKVLFSLLKLTEFERLFSGQAPDQHFRIGAKLKVDLPMGLEPFSLRSGGLDINLLAPMVIAARAEPVLGPIAMALLDRLNEDPGTIFRRLSTMRKRIEARRAGA